MIIRELSGHAGMEQLIQCFAKIWNASDEEVTPKETLVAAELSGHQLLGAFDSERLIGGSWGFLTLEHGVLGLHSHITGVLPRYQGTGAGLALKLEQKRWCIERGITTVTWTFDPMIARNAAFNLRKLGARAIAYREDFYGAMNDGYNAGEPTDRLEIAWDLTLVTRTTAPKHSSEHIVAVPIDYLELKSRDPARAQAERLRVREHMQALFAKGLTATWFNEHGYRFDQDNPPNDA